MSDALRDYVIRTLIDDQATDTLESILATAETLAANSYEVLVGADTEAAQRQIESVRSSVSSLTGSYDSMAQAMSSGQAPRMTAKEIESLGWAADGAEKSSSSLRGTLDQLTESSKGVADGAATMVNALSGMAMLGAAAGLGNLVEGAVEENRAAKDQLAFLRQTIGEHADLVEQWAEQGDKIYGSSKDSRMNAASILMQRGFTDPEQIIDIAEAASTIANSAQGRQMGITSSSDLIQMVSSGRATPALRGLMPELFDEDALKATGLDERSARMELMPDALKSAAAKVTPDTDGYNAAIREMDKQTSIFRQNLGDTFEPLLQGVFQAIGAIESLANSNPAITTIVGSVLLLGIVAGATAGALTLASIAGGIASTVFFGGATAAGVWATAQAILNGEIALTEVLLGAPIALAGIAIVAVVALVAALALLESKTHALSGAWEVFSKSQIGQDMIGGVQALLELMGQFGGEFFSGAIASALNLQSFIGELFQTVDGLYKYLKETGSLDIVLAFAFGGPVGMMYAVLQESHKSFMDFYEFIRGAWSDITDLPGKIGEFIKSLPGAIVDAITGKGGGDKLSGGELQEKIKTQLAEKYHNATQEQLDFAAKYGAKYGAGEKDIDLGGITATDLSIPEIMLMDAKDLGKTLGGGETAKPQEKTPEDAAKRGFNDGLDEAAKEAAANTQDRMDQGYGGGSGFAQADWSIASPFKYTLSGLKSSLGGISDYYMKNAVGGGSTPSASTSGGTQPPSVESTEPPKPSEPAENTSFELDGKYQRIDDPSVVIWGKEASNDLDPRDYVRIAHSGGITQSSGLVSVAPGEPIIPAEIASSSQLLDMLDLIANTPTAVMPPEGAYGGQPVSVSAPMTVNLGGVHINGQSERIDEDSILRRVQDLLDRHLSRFELERLIEEVYVNKVRTQTG